MNFPSPKHYLIIGASRGIGLEFTRQLLLASPTNIVIATHRSTETPQTLQELDKRFHSPPRLWTVKCDVGDESTIESLCLAVSVLLERGGREKCIETVIVNAGVLEWPGGVLGGTSQSYNHHFQTNTIGPLLAAKHVLSIPRCRISTISFISSDSGSATKFRSFEDGFAAYAASKAALNMGLRHLAAELHRKRGVEAPIILALHPGEPRVILIQHRPRRIMHAAAHARPQPGRDRILPPDPRAAHETLLARHQRRIRRMLSGQGAQLPHIDHASQARPADVPHAPHQVAGQLAPEARAALQDRDFEAARLRGGLPGEEFGGGVGVVPGRRGG
ncbi:hypothetical protein EYC84_003924 [Monilinia fructicola]|uniref:Ketoreductase (KR) domain-containing protein n=1 Tax=Monilinia fructicola TaxID=38448 RepID=A0A5M9JYP4_MONFR|nr:hypothetical protein EYC84_003924 [Monilinia fructicola]